jgi:hypothetical protein
MILAMSYVNRDLTFEAGGYRFGFADLTYAGIPGVSESFPYTRAHMGPLGSYRVPVSAAAGWAITLLLLISAVAAVGWLGFRRRRRRPA